MRGKVKRTTIADPAAERARDLVAPQLHAAGPGPAVGRRHHLRLDVVGVGVRRVRDRRLRPADPGLAVPARRMTTQLVLDALEQAIWTRQRDGRSPGSVVAHTDRGSQYPSIRYTERLAEAGIAASVGVGRLSYDNALAETINGLYKTELIKPRGPWRTVDAVEFATAEWVDWFNHRRLYEYCGDIPPAELEAATTLKPEPASR